MDRLRFLPAECQDASRETSDVRESNLALGADGEGSESKGRGGGGLAGWGGGATQFYINIFTGYRLAPWGLRIKGIEIFNYRHA